LRHTLPAGGLLSISDWQGLIRQLYDIKSDDDHFRKAIAMAPDERGEFFLDCRKLYPRRRSFTMHELIVDEPPSPEIRTALERGLKLTLIPAP
jgi:erythronate-4-phosphate dehydrogenase